MPTTEIIYGAECVIPDPPPEHEIDGYGLPNSEQYWQRKPYPPFFRRVEIDKQGTPIYTPEQEAYANKEIERCKKGYWFFNNGKPTFLTGKNYFYLQWWKLETDQYPDYRDVDRRYFMFLDYWEKREYCLGIIRGKKRREGATSQATANLIYECIFFTDSKCGLVSKSKDDAKAAFTDMVAFGYRKLPIFLKPLQVNKETAATELIFANRTSYFKDKNQNAYLDLGDEDDSGGFSRVNYKAPALNAYDSGRLSRALVDEGGKFPTEVPTSTLLSIISKTLVRGVKRVGFIEMPSTVNSLTKGTGSEFKKIWVQGNQFAQTPTVNRLARYFMPAYDGFEGFIDKYGVSVIDEPTPEQYEYLVSKYVKRDPETNDLLSPLSEEDIKMGAKQYIKVKLRAGKEGDDLEEEIRMNPCDEDELFQSAASDCHFNSLNIQAQRKIIETTPPILRRVTFFRVLDEDGMPKGVNWREDKDGSWLIYALPSDEEKNKFEFEGKLQVPSNTHKYVMGIDGYSNSQGGRKYGSKAAAFIMDRANMMYIAMYYNRPRTKELLHEQILLACEFYGCKVWYEFTSDDYKGYFQQRGKLGYLGRFPLSVIDPKDREKERPYGFPITPFAMTKQLDNLIAYAETDKDTGFSYCFKIWFDLLLEQMIVFQAENRHKSDAVVAAMITLCCALEPAPKPIKLPDGFIQTYKNDEGLGY